MATAGLRAHAVDPLGLLPAGQGETPALRERHLLEGVVLVLDIDVLPRRRPIAEDPDAGRMQPHSGQPVRLGIRQRTQQQRIHHAENGRIGADSDGQGSRHHESQPSVVAKHARRVAKVL
jgi:hypothetical protein